MTYLFRLISLMIGYFFGNFLSGFFYGKSKNVDLTKEGSGNVGTTNTLRILGVRAGALTLVLDCLKSVLAALLIYLIFRGRTETESALRLLMLYAAFGAVLGHDFPFFMGFKGGKGIASSLGMLLVCFPLTLPLCVLVFAVTLAVTRYVSLGSILTAVTFLIEVILFGVLGLLPYEGKDLPEAVIIGCIAAVLAIFLHRSNIKRLLNHNENKFTFHPKTKA